MSNADDNPLAVKVKAFRQIVVFSMKLFQIILILGISLIIFGIYISVSFDDCRSDLSIGGERCAPTPSLPEFAQAAEIAGVVCILISFGLFHQEKKKTSSILGNEQS